MKGKDPRDAHFITSRICGICGDNHATCSCLRAEHGLRRQAAGTSPSGSSTSARPPSTCSTTTSSRRTWSASTSARRWSRRPIPASGRRPRRREAPARRRPRLPDDRRHHAGAQSVRGRVLPRGAADQPLHPRDVLPDGRAARPPLDALSGRRRHRRRRSSSSPTTSPGCMRYVEFMKRVVPLHDDLFDFFYEALPATSRSASGASCSAAGAPSRTRRSATSTTRT